MNFLSLISKRRVVGLAGSCALALAGVGWLSVPGAGQASAATCTPGTPCTITGTATLGSGTLSLTTPTSLAWSTTLNGIAQQLVDTTPADENLVVDDASGTGAGWHVTVSATTFTSGTNTLPDATTLVANGSGTSETTGATPSVNCTTAGDCTVPTSATAVTYPLAIATAATAPAPVTLYSADAGTGMGSVLFGANATLGTNPLGWWVNVPGNTHTGAYTSTFSFNIISGP